VALAIVARLLGADVGRRASGEDAWTIRTVRQLVGDHFDAFKHDRLSERRILARMKMAVGKTSTDLDLAEAGPGQGAEIVVEGQAAADAAGAKARIVPQLVRQGRRRDRIRGEEAAPDLEHANHFR